MLSALFGQPGEAKRSHDQHVSRQKFFAHELAQQVRQGARIVCRWLSSMRVSLLAQGKADSRICIGLGKIHVEIAQQLPPTVSKQAVTKALSGAKWYVVRE